MKKLILISYLLLVAAITISAQQNDFPKLTGPYLGQKPPGMTPEIFAPGIISLPSREHNCPSFSANGMEIFFSVVYYTPHNVIFSMHEENGIWSPPGVMSLCGEYQDDGPFLSPDQNRLFFISNRPLQGGTESKDSDIWYVERTDAGWGSPINAGSVVNSEYGEYHLTVSANGTLYFNSDRPGGYGKDDIYLSQWTNGHYVKPKNLGESINTKYLELQPFVSPDESYLIFSSNRPGGLGWLDLYISFKRADGSWTKARNMGNIINTETWDGSPYVTLDGKYFLFCSNRMCPPVTVENSPTFQIIQSILPHLKIDPGNVFWVDARIIQTLK